MKILDPPYHRQECCRHKERKQAPKVNLSQRGMAPSPFFAQHCKSTDGYTDETQRDMNAHDHCQKKWIGRRNFNPSQICGVIDHAWSILFARLAASAYANMSHRCGR